MAFNECFGFFRVVDYKSSVSLSTLKHTYNTSKVMFEANE